MSIYEMIFGQAKSGGTDNRAIACPKCGATCYQLADNEVLGRTQMPGRRVVTRETECPECKATGTIKVQVRA